MYLADTHIYIDNFYIHSFDHFMIFNYVNVQTDRPTNLFLEAPRMELKNSSYSFSNNVLVDENFIGFTD